MSDINPKTQTAALAEATDLSELSASKDLHRGLSATPANSTDLASASISAADVMRVAQRADIRKAVQGVVTPHHTSVELTNSRSRSTGTKADGTTTAGIFKNSFYRYDGGILNKILALIGNILKALERIFLRLLGARDTAPQPDRPQTSKSKPDSAPNASEERQQLEREKRKERREQAELLIRRQ